MTLQRLHSVAEVAEALGETERFVKDHCRAGLWPHRRGARGRISFTAEDYARVLELIAADVTTEQSPRLSFAPRSRRGAA
jgi:hypothetical protein